MDIEAPSKAVEIVPEMQGKFDKMHQKLEELQCKLSQTESNLKRSVFCFQNIKDDELIKFYIGFPYKATLMAFYEEILEDNAMIMRQWEGKRSEDHYDDIKTGRPHRLPHMEQLFLTLVRLHLRTRFSQQIQHFDILCFMYNCHMG